MEINWRTVKEVGDQDTIGCLKNGMYFWTWNTGYGKSPEELLEMGDLDGENGGKIFSSLDNLLGYLQGNRDDLVEFVKENF